MMYGIVLLQVMKDLITKSTKGSILKRMPNSTCMRGRRQEALQAFLCRMIQQGKQQFVLETPLKFSFKAGCLINSLIKVIPSATLTAFHQI